LRQHKGSRIAWPAPAGLLLFELAFLIAYRAGVASAQNSAAPFRFACAVLLCSLLLSRSKEWWLYILLTVPITFLLVPPDTPFSFVFGSFVSDTAKSLLATWLLRRYSQDGAWFDDVREFSKYFLAAVVLAPAIFAFADAASHTALGHSFWTSWNICFLGSALANLVLGPLILLAPNYEQFIQKRRYAEAFVIAAGLAGIAFIMDVRLQRAAVGVGLPSFLPYLPLPLLLWSGVSFGPAGAAGSLLLMNVLAIRFDPHIPEAGLLSMQLSLFLVSAPLMFVSVIAWQQRRNLIETEERFRSMVDAAPVMLWMSGNDARGTFFNKSWLDFTNLSLKEHVEQDWVLRVHPEDRERCVNQYLSAFRSRERFSLEYRLLRSDGVYRWILHNGAPRYAADGSFLGYIGTRIDFTDRREAEEHLREVSTRLLNAEEQQRDRIGHELHDDLAQKLWVLSMDLTRLSLKRSRNRRLAADFDELQHQLRDVTKSIVRLSRQLRPPTVEGLGLSAALRNLCQEATDHKRTVVFVQNADVPPLPEDISLPVYRIAQEALRNALRHSGATCIHVELSVTATLVRLSVRDNGRGFVTASNSRPRLGLAGMSGRMRIAGGVVNVTSNPGEGTAVIAILPLTESMEISPTVMPAR